jgi:hypothetical protein
MYDREREFDGDETSSLLSSIKTYENEMMIATTATDEIKMILFIKNVRGIFQHKAL